MATATASKVVRGEQNCGLLLGEGTDRGPEVLGAGGVEAARRLVEQ